jgi:hypothetical protein
MSGCFGLISGGDAVAWAASYTILSTQTITSP